VKKIALITFLLLFVIGLFLGVRVYNMLYAPNVQDEAPEILFIPTGSHFDQVEQLLIPYLKDVEGFSRVARLRKYPQAIKPGRYIIPRGANNMDVVTRLRSGNQSPLMVTFNNVKSLAQVCGVVSAQLEFDSLACYEAFMNPEFLTSHGLNAATVKSILIPDSYEFFWTSTPEVFRDRMVSEFKRFWNDARLDQAKSVNLTPLEVSILASIVVRETSKRDEMARVAGLYLNRLRKNIKLQSDPTVIYGIQQALGRDTLIRRVLYKDLEFDSPYNTYIYPGLPPAPIAIAEGFAIDAVLQAEQHRYIFMCADPDRPGYHSFATNDREHANNKRKYVQWLQRERIYR
jgi:UPF0755 protein